MQLNTIQITSIKDIRDDFTEYMRYQGYSDKTLKATLYEAKWFERYAFSIDTALNVFSLKHAYSFQKYLLEEVKNRVYIHAILGAVNRLYIFFIYKEISVFNPFKSLKRVKLPFKLPKGLPKEEQMNKFLSHLACFADTPNLMRAKTLYRYHVMSEFMYCTGMRISEACSIELEDVDLVNGTVLYDPLKCGEKTYCFLNEYVKEVLRIYISLRDVLFVKKHRKQLLFGVRAARINYEYNKHLNQTALKAGLKYFSSHYFRHCFGYHLLRAGCDIRLIQQLMGHKRITSTEIYTKVDKQSLLQVLDAYHPRSLRGKT